MYHKRRGIIMTDKNKILENPGIEIPETLIPNDDIDISKWAVNSL
jgi:hypothetical protein